MLSVFKKTKNISGRKLRYLLSVVTAVTMLAIFGLNYSYEGTAASKYAARQSEVERVNDKDIENYTDMMLFGDPVQAVDPDIDLTVKATADQGFEETERIHQIDKMVLLALTVFSLLMLLPILQKNGYLRHLYLLIAIYILVQAYYQGLNGGKKFADVAILAHATRWLLALALWLWLWKPNAEITVGWILKIACALTFATHGIEAFLLNPPFQHLLYSGFELIGVTVNQTVCHTLLKSIGIMDISLALGVLFCKKPKLLLWMAFWGALTALSRPICLGNEFWLEALLRTANCLAPLALYYFYQLSNTNTQPTYKYEKQNT